MLYLNQIDINVRLQLARQSFSSLVKTYSDDLRFGRKCAKENQRKLMLLNIYLEMLDCYQYLRPEVTEVTEVTTKTANTNFSDVPTLDLPSLSARFVDGWKFYVQAGFPGYDVTNPAYTVFNSGSSLANYNQMLSEMNTYQSQITSYSQIITSPFGPQYHIFSTESLILNHTVINFNFKDDLDVAKSGFQGLFVNDAPIIIIPGQTEVTEDDNCVTEEEIQDTIEKISILSDVCFKSINYSYKPNT